MPELDRALLFLRQGYAVQQRKAIDRFGPAPARSKPPHTPRDRQSDRRSKDAHIHAAAAPSSLPALVRARGRAAFDALRGPLEAALDALEDDAEVGGLRLRRAQPGRAPGQRGSIHGSASPVWRHPLVQKTPHASL
jgi:hypothetical protein